MISIEEIEARVDRGFALMDDRGPGWWREDHSFPVDLDKLDILSPCNCILGQTYDKPWVINRFYQHSEELFDGEDFDDHCDLEVAHGFNVHDDFGKTDEEVEAEAEALENVWKRRILARREVADEC